MTFTVDAIMIPIILTIVLIIIMCRPSASYDFLGIFRIFWLIPIAIVWCAYFGYGWWDATHQNKELKPNVEVNQNVKH